jgi:hypothetical protein
VETPSKVSPVEEVDSYRKWTPPWFRTTSYDQINDGLISATPDYFFVLSIFGTEVLRLLFPETGCSYLLTLQPALPTRKADGRKLPTAFFSSKARALL